MSESQVTEMENISPGKIKENTSATDPQEAAKNSDSEEISIDPLSDGEQKVDSDILLRENENGSRDLPVEPKLSVSQNHIGTDDVNPSKCQACCKVFGTARFQVYVSHFLSSWGDRMWMFAGGLFLYEVTPGSLRLAAVYGAALALTVIIFGAPVGRLVDRTSRLKTAQISLCIQNVMVCVCAAILVVMTTQRHLFTAWDGWALIVAEGFVILTACMAQIGTLGSKLTIEKDWILVICGQDKTRLAGMNSVLRSLDLSTEVLAPVIVGAVMTTFGMAAGGIVIACWNVGSLLVEYGLLHYLFYSNEDLRKPKLIYVDNQKDNEDGMVDHSKVTKWSVLKGRLISAWGSWLAYMKHPVRDAGLGLALLFMTVLAFDNYSRAFVFESGVSESILGLLTAVASLFGIFGALSYPKLRSKFGIAKTGLFGFGAETFCLTLCVASVFAPGSPFDASALISSGQSSVQVNVPKPTTSSDIVYNATVLPSVVNTSIILDQNITAKLTIYSTNSTNDVEIEYDYTSVTLLLAGIITSRTGLWLADLSVTQILQEGVEEGQRGAINGVQSSLNQSLDLMRSILLIILPTRATFGFLILLSFIFVATGWMLFGVYARKQIRRSSDAKPSEDQHLSKSLDV